MNVYQKFEVWAALNHFKILVPIGVDPAKSKWIINLQEYLWNEKSTNNEEYQETYLQYIEPEHYKVANSE